MGRCYWSGTVTKDTSIWKLSIYKFVTAGLVVTASELVASATMDGIMAAVAQAAVPGTSVTLMELGPDPTIITSPPVYSPAARAMGSRTATMHRKQTRGRKSRFLIQRCIIYSLFTFPLMNADGLEQSFATTV